jgi:exonuclease VII large subunit
MDERQQRRQPANITPTAAATAANVSRWRIMKAINSQELKAIRDNRNNWQIAQADFDEWHRRHSNNSVGRQETDSNDDNDKTARLQRHLAAETARADAAEADRDRWHRMAEQLAKKPRFSWPWSR